MGHPELGPFDVGLVAALADLGVAAAPGWGDSAGAWLRGLPETKFHLLEGGPWRLETCLEEAVALSRDFLDRDRPPG